MRRRALVLVLASAAALALAGAGSAGNGGFLPASPESPNADDISTIYIVVLGVAGVVLVLAWGALVLLVVRRRRAPVGQVDASEGGGHTQLVWTVVPIVVLSALASFALFKLPDIIDAPAAGATGETRILVEAHQFYWLFRYPGGAVTINEMVAPADEVVHLDVTAPENDVNHSWWVPQLGGKIDAIPGRTNETWFKASEGTYDARCAELCGIQHAVMNGTVKVVPHAEFVAFLRDKLTKAELGQQQFEGVCLTCHRLDEPFIGPALAGNPTLTDRDRLEQLVREGVGTMPAVGSTWTKDEVDALAAYTKGLSASG